jgi:amidase
VLSAAPLEEEADDVRAWQAYVAALDQQLPAGTVVVMPVMADLAPLRTASSAELQEFRAVTLRFTAPASLSGRPELVIPVRHGPSGKSVGVGILGAGGSDAELLRAAAAIGLADGALEL